MTTTQHENPPHVAHLVDAYVAGVLDADARRGVDDHAAGCPACAAALADAMSADAVLSVALAAARPSAGFEDRVAAGVRDGIRRQGWRRWASPSSYPILGSPAARHPLVRRIATGVAAAVVLGAVGYGASVGADREERAGKAAMKVFGPRLMSESALGARERVATSADAGVSEEITWASKATGAHGPASSVVTRNPASGGEVAAGQTSHDWYEYNGRAGAAQTVDSALLPTDRNADGTSGDPAISRRTHRMDALDRAPSLEQRKGRERSEVDATKQLSVAGEKKTPYDDITRYPADWPDISGVREQTVAQAGAAGAANQTAEAGTVPNSGDSIATASVGGQQSGGQQAAQGLAFGRGTTGAAKTSPQAYFRDSLVRDKADGYALKPVAPDELALGLPGLQVTNGQTTSLYANANGDRSRVLAEVDKKKSGDGETASPAGNGKPVERGSVAASGDVGGKLAVRLDGTTVTGTTASGPQSADSDGLTKAGAGTLVLSGSNMSVGGIAVSGGVVATDGRDASGPVAGTKLGYTSTGLDVSAGKPVALKGVKENEASQNPNNHYATNWSFGAPGRGGAGGADGKGVALSFGEQSNQWDLQRPQIEVEGVKKSVSVPDGGTVLLGGQRVAGVVYEPTVTGPVAAFGTPARDEKRSGATPADPAAPVSVATATPPKLEKGYVYQPGKDGKNVDEAQRAKEESIAYVGKLPAGEADKAEVGKKFFDFEAADVKGKQWQEKPGESKPADAASSAKDSKDAVAKLEADKSVETLNKLVGDQRKVIDAAKGQQNPELGREVKARNEAELKLAEAKPEARELRQDAAGRVVADLRDGDGDKKPLATESPKPGGTVPTADPKSGRESSGDAPAKVPEPAPPAKPAPQTAKPPVEPRPAQPVRRMVIRNGEVVFEVDSFDGAVNTITKIAAEEGGVVTTTTSDKLPNGKVSGSVTVRCPPERLDTLVLKLRGIGDLKSQQLAAQDVTKQYTDISAQLRAATTMEQRLLDIIKAGGAVKDLLEAEKQLGVWRQRVEQLQGEINYYENLVANSTLVVQLQERDVRSPTAAYETENVQAGIEADDVEKARADALAAIDKVKGRVVDSDLQKLQGDQFQATIVADVAPDRAGEVIDRLKQLGRVARLEASRKTVTSGGPGPIVAGLKVERRETRLQVSIYNLARVAPRQNTTLSVAAADVEAAYNNVLKQAAASGGRVVTSKLERPRPDTVVGAVRVEVPADKAETVLTAVRAGVDVMRMNVVVNPDAANTTEAKRGFDLEIRSLADVPAREQTTLQVYSGAVQAAFAKLTEAAKAGGGRVYASQLNEQDPNNLQGTLEFDVPRDKWGPIDAALKEAGLTVSRNVTRSNDPENTVDSKIRLRVELLDEVRLTPREQVTAIVATATAQEAFYALTDAAKAAGARAVSSNLNVSDRTNPTGEIIFSVAREQSSAFEAGLKSAGFLVSRTTARQADGPTTVENRVGYRVSVIDEERLTPREAIDARVAVPAVSEAFTALLDAAKAAGARTIGSSLNLSDRSNPTGTLMFSVAREKAAAFETALRGAGLLVSRTANRQQDGVTTVDNRVGFRVTVIDEGKLIARETVRTRVASRTVGETYRRLVAAAQRAGARVVRSDLNENDLLRPTGSITFAIDRQAANEFEAAMAKDKDALVVTRNTERRAEQQDVVEQKVGYDVTVVAERTLTPREVRSMVVVAPSARDRYAKALETAVAADAYVLTSQLVREGESGVYGELDLVIERRRLPEFEAALTGGADVFGRDVARSVDPSSADHLIRVRTVIRDADRQSPRQTYDLTVATKDVDKAVGDLEALAAQVGGRKVDSQRRTNEQGQDEGVIVLNVPLNRAGEVVNAARAAGHTTQASSNRDDRVPEGALSRATLTVRLQAAPTVGASRGLGETLREGVNTGLTGLVVGLKYIIMGLLLVVPVLLVAWVVVRLFRGPRRRTTVVTPPPPGTPPTAGGPTPTPA